MRFANKVQQLENTLSPFVAIWNQEPIHQFPNHLDSYPEEWVDFLLNSDESTQLKISKRQVPASIKSLKRLMQEIEALCHFGPAPRGELEKIDPHAWMGVKGKKQHEIQRLLEFLAKEKPKRILDICGGQGNFAYLTSRHLGIEVESLDFDPELQQMGLQKNKKLVQQGRPPIRFRHGDLQSDLNNLPRVFKEHQTSIGLHTCGPLAVNHIELAKSAEQKQFLNLGCCYHRLQKSPKNMATESRLVAIMSHFALTLATRGHINITEADFQMKKRVKNYRYAFHLLLNQQLGIEEFISLGNTPPRVYRQDFQSYCEYQLKNLGPKFSQLKRVQLNSFYDSPSTQKIIGEVFAATLIRFLMGRGLECLILTDRCLRLENKGYDVDMFAFFEEKISPRNLGIWANRQ